MSLLPKVAERKRKKKSSLGQFLVTERPLKMVKNAFYFTLKALCLLSYLSFCPDFNGDAGKRLDKKAKTGRN